MDDAFLVVVLAGQQSVSDMADLEPEMFVVVPACSAELSQRDRSRSNRPRRRELQRLLSAASSAAEDDSPLQAGVRQLAVSHSAGADSENSRLGMQVQTAGPASQTTVTIFPSPATCL